MATKKYLSLERLTEYDELLKAEIAEGDDTTLASAKSYTDTEVAKKAAKSHTHAISDVTNLQTTIDTINSEVDGSIKGLSASGKTITYTKNDGTTGTITTQDTTYSAASTSAAGLMSSSDKTKLNYTNIAYGTCSTAAATAAKVITISGNTKWALTAGSMITVLFSTTNTASNPTFNVNGTGAKNVYYANAQITTTSLSYAGYASRPMNYMYDGTQYIFIGWGVDNNSDSKVTQTVTTTDAEYPLLASTTASATATATTTARFASGVTLNPADKSITATTFIGALSGNATSASSATKATKDGSGNTITSTYETKSAATSKLEEAKTYADTAASTAAAAVKNDLLNGAGEAYDTLKELGDLIGDNADAIDALETVAAGKQNTITGAASTITGSNLTASRALIANSSGKVAVSDITSTELSYLDGVTSNIQTQLDGKSASGHTHNYAGSSSAGGAATSANKINTDAGSATNPVYFSNGIPVKTTYTLGKSVPSDAKFTDTTYSNATTSAAGLMSTTDKKRVDAFAGSYSLGSMNDKTIADLQTALDTWLNSYSAIHLPS